MQNLVVGNLMGLEETKISISSRAGDVKIYPRQELDLSLDWVFDHLGKQVMCLLRDGIVTQVKALS